MNMVAMASMDLKASSKDSINLSLQRVLSILQVRMLAHLLEDGILPENNLDSV